MKRIYIQRKETPITKEEAKQFILKNVFAGVGQSLRESDFVGRVVACGMEEGRDGELEQLINELIAEGKLRMEYARVHAAAGMSGWFLFIKRIA